MIDESEERPWEQPDAVRRDCEPHRAELLAWIGPVAVFFGTLAGLSTGLIYVAAGPGYVFGLSILLAVTGLGFGATLWTLAGNDLRAMKAGSMDRTGYDRTLAAYKVACLANRLSFWSLVLASVGLGRARLPW